MSTAPNANITTPRNSSHPFAILVWCIAPVMASIAIHAAATTEKGIASDGSQTATGLDSTLGSRHVRSTSVPLPGAEVTAALPPTEDICPGIDLLRPCLL